MAQNGGKGGVFVQGPPGLDATSGPPQGAFGGGPAPGNSRGFQAAATAAVGPMLQQSGLAAGNWGTPANAPCGPSRGASGCGPYWGGPPRGPMMPNGVQGPCMHHASPGNHRTASAAAAALQKFAAMAEAEAKGETPVLSEEEQHAIVEESLRRRHSAEEAAKATASRLKQSNYLASLRKDPDRMEGVLEAAGDLGERYVGTIKAFSAAQGFGFIMNQDVLKRFGCDAFFNQAVQGGIHIGGTVAFTLEISRNGRPQASNIVMQELPKSGADGRSQGPSGPSVMQKELVGKVFRGRCKSFNANRGFGFIACNEVQIAFGGRDIYVSHAQVPEEGRLTAGREYDFRLFVDRQGQPQARELQIVDLATALNVKSDLGPIEAPNIQSVSYKLFNS
eukprot:TRINITY_DN46489_c0_g1_i1.p1 TRINITY_DN46489_c0_g1~~TRINITY_DN46489_c0_g1_i1.p1  ORF type:complete len:405 (+),score=75.59 TRINITY_DN46489_c0_g1_i1:40-1215(+)